MPYEYNPLIKDCFQKTSEVSPSDIDSLEGQITDLKQKKVTKFFSANDYLEDNEIAQYQGDDDSANNLQNGFFYKKNPAFTITPNSDTFAYNVNRKLKIFNFDGTFFEQYYLAGQNISTSDYVVIGLYDESIFTVCFNPALFVNRSLPPTADGNMIFYPFLNVNGVWDFSNPVSVSGGNYYYKGNQIRLIPLRLGLINAAVGANMTSPYNRYLWVSLLMSKYQSVFAFPYATNSNNELIALGVSNGLGAFGFQSYYTINSIASTTINVQGYTLTENQVFTAVQTDEIAEASESNAGLMSAADKKLINILNANNTKILFINNYTYEGSLLDIENACKWLVSELNENVRNGESQIFEGTIECTHLFFYQGSVIPPQYLLQHSSFTLLNIATGERYLFGYSGAQWYFNSL